MLVALVNPEIPPNTGNVARLCAATRTPLHLVEPLGFEITDKRLKRAGLDYWPYLELQRHASLSSFLDFLMKLPTDGLFFLSKKAQRSYVDASFGPNPALIFGCETSGLPQVLERRYPERFWRIPIFEPGVRSLNLSSAVAIVAYEALRQQGRLK